VVPTLAIAGYNYDGLDAFIFVAGLIVVLFLGSVLAIGLAVLRVDRDPSPPLRPAVLAGYAWAAILVIATANIRYFAHRERAFFSVLAAGGVAFWIVVWRIWSRRRP
jgi:hypothetical protein